MKAGQRRTAGAIGSAVLARPPNVQQLVGTASQIVATGRCGRVPRRREQRAVAMVRVLRIVEGIRVADGGAAVPTDRYGFGGNGCAGDWPGHNVCGHVRQDGGWWWCATELAVDQIKRENGSRRQNMGREMITETNTLAI